MKPSEQHQQSLPAFADPLQPYVPSLADLFPLPDTDWPVWTAPPEPLFSDSVGGEMVPQVVTSDAFELLPFDSFVPTPPTELPNLLQPPDALPSTADAPSWDESSPDTGADTDSQAGFNGLGGCAKPDEDPRQAAVTKPKQGRPVADRSLGDEQLVRVFRNKLRSAFSRIEQKFQGDSSRTDKYRTMFVRQCRRVLAEAMSLIGVDSYSKSTDVERFLPEYQKRYAVMKRLVEASVDHLASSGAASLDN